MTQKDNKTSSRPHERSAHVQAHAQGIEVGLFDIIIDSIVIQCAVDNKIYTLDLDEGWFIKSTLEWHCFVDEYNRAGTSQIFSALRFHIIGQRMNGFCYAYGLRVNAILPNETEFGIPYSVICIDSENHQVKSKKDAQGELMDMDTNDKIKAAKKLIKTLCSRNHYKLAFSGGKDSVVLNWLIKEAGVKIPLVYNNTTIDPPGTISFCRRMKAEINKPKRTFFQLVERKGYPSMFRRFCCNFLKERYISDYLITGVRKSESVKRNKIYCAFEDTYEFSKKVRTQRLHPLLYFTSIDILEIVNTHQLECHPLYYDEKGQFHVEKRLGCIGCPLQGDRGVTELKNYPKFLLQLCKAGNTFHRKQGRTEQDSYENLVYNLFYSNHGYKKFIAAFKGMFPLNPKEILEKEFNVKLP